MEIAFCLLVILLMAIAIWEYVTGRVLDIAFTGILTWRQNARGKFLRIIFAQLVVWIFLLFAIFLTYEIIFKPGSVDFRRVRTYIVIIFILIIFPFAVIRKKFASWVKKTAAAKRGK